MQYNKLPFDTKSLPFEIKDLPFEIKSFDEETGIFDGYAAVIGNEDDGGDILEPGAFKKTLEENSHRVKVCYQHNPHEPIGKPLEMREVPLTEVPEPHRSKFAKMGAVGALYTKSKLSMTTRGKDTYILMKDKVITELSIGYDTVKKSFDEKGRRHLKEVRLWEYSPVTWAMNELAGIGDVKGVKTMDKIENIKADFNTLLQLEQLEDIFWKIFRVLRQSIEGIIADENITDKQAAVTQSIDQFRATIMAWIVKAEQMNMIANEAAVSGMMSAALALEAKAGHVVPSVTKQAIEECIKGLQTLLDSPEPDDSTSGEKGAVSNKDNEPEIHSLLQEMKKLSQNMKGEGK